MSAIPVTLERVTITNSTAIDYGGAIYTEDFMTLKIIDSTFSGNSAGEYGGALDANDTVTTITGSTFAGNTSPRGGAVDMYTANSSLVATNSTFTGNQDQAFYIFGSQVRLFSSTVSGNGAATTFSGAVVGSATAWASAVADTCGLPFGAGSDYNALSHSCLPAESAHNITPADFDLGELAANGGWTQTMLPRSESPLISAIPEGVADIPATDQRGIPRSAPYWIGAVQNSGARNPVFDTPVPTADGFAVNVTNYDPAWTWTPAVVDPSGASVVAGTHSGTTLPLTITGLSPGQSGKVRVETDRAGYDPGSSEITGTATTGAARNPVFDTPTPTVDGFTVNVT
ncbi:MAG: choice-of-anchor Q domain-containing protein, partial [Candidatus Nanopelagicales bacterium]